MESVPAASAGTEQQFITWEVVGNVFEVPSYYTDVQAIGIGGFGLVWYLNRLAGGRVACTANAPDGRGLAARPCVQLGTKHADGHERSDQEGAQAVLDANALQANLPRAGIAQAHAS